MYQLILIDEENNWKLAYETKNIFDIDCLTGQYSTKEELLKETGIKFNKKFKDVFIISSFQNKKRNIYDIIYADDVFPEQNFFEHKYATYLYKDKKRIRDSFLYSIKNFRNDNMAAISYFELLRIVSKYMDSYRKKRDCYFQLINSGELKPKDIKFNKDDYLKSIIDNIDTDDGTDKDIIIDKIKTGEIEPNYFDIEEYLSMKRSKKR